MLLLRLTGEILNSVPGYTPDDLDWLQDLDRGWLAVLGSRGWGSEARSGINVVLPDGVRSGSSSQTEPTRLKSMLVAGAEMGEERLLKELAEEKGDNRRLIHDGGVQLCVSIERGASRAAIP